MARIILIITSLLTLGAVVLGVQNRAAFIDTRSEKDDHNESIRATLDATEEVIAELREVQQSVTDTEGERDVARVGTEETSRKIGNVEAQITSVDEKIKQKENRIAEVENALKPWAGMTIENLNDRLDEMKKDVADREEEIAILEKEIQLAQAAVDANRSTISDYQLRQRARSDAIGLDGSEATVTAVNPDWGFVIVNAGRNRGIPGNAKLIVKRGSEVIGQLKIVSLEPNMLVADIVQDTLNKGAQVLPGDRVVFDTGVN